MNAADQEELIMIKGKRTKRPRPSSPLELTMDAAGSSSIAAAAAGGDVVMSDGVSDRTNPSLSDSGELTHDDEEEDMAHCLILLAKGQRQRMSPQPAAAAGEVYQCKTCSKSFSSFQALGGHRASHKKPINKPPLLTLGDQKEIIKQQYFQSNPRSTILSLQIANNKITRVHECSLCGAEFASGQALGGHMRRHRPIPAASISSRHGESSSSEEVKIRERNMLLSLDLNMPAAPEEDLPAAESKFAFAPQEQVIVFSATPLIDCHY